MPTIWPTCWWLSPTNPTQRSNPNRSERDAPRTRGGPPAVVAVRWCAMTAAGATVSIGTTDTVHAREAPASAADASLVTLPATRMPVDARGLALAILAALASVLALSWAQGFVVPLLL